MGDVVRNSSTSSCHALAIIQVSQETLNRQDKEMRLVFPSRLLLLLLSLAVFFSARHDAFAQEPPDAASIIAMPGSFLEFAVGNALLAAMNGDDTQLDVLEAVAKTLRSSKVRVETGSWKLAVLYDSIAVQPNDPKFQKLIEHWHSRWPGSPTPYIIQAQALLVGIYSIPWSQQRDLPDPRDHTISLEAIKELQRHLENSRAAANADPHWYTLAARARVLAEADEATSETTETFSNFVLEGIAREPTYDELYAAGTYYFLQKWSGVLANGESLEKWALAASAASNKAGLNSGYARVYWHAFKSQYGREIFSGSKLDWPHFRTSADAYIVEDPTSRIQDRALFLACLAGDRGETRRLFSVRAKKMMFDDYAAQELVGVCRSWAAAPAWRVTLENFVERMSPDFMAYFHYLSLTWQNLDRFSTS
jgi:hypothetical protein